MFYSSGGDAENGGEDENKDQCESLAVCGKED